MFGQTFAPGDLATVGFLVILEGLLSIDNALVLGVLAQRVAPPLRMKALSYGLIGGLLLRLAAIAAAAILLRFSILKLLGGSISCGYPSTIFYERKPTCLQPIPRRSRAVGFGASSPPSN